MKVTIFKPFATIALGAFIFFSCAGSTESETTQETLDQETFDEAEVVGDVADEPVKEDLDYADMFENVETENYDIMTLASMEENLSGFVQLVELSGLDTSIEFAGPVTVFAPTNEALKQMPEEKYEFLVNPENQTELIRFIRHHILPNEVPQIQFNSSQIIETAGENEIPVDVEMDGNVVYVGGAQIVKPDIDATNGIIHIVNGVIEPSEFTNVAPE